MERWGLIKIERWRRSCLPPLPSSLSSSSSSIVGIIIFLLHPRSLPPRPSSSSSFSFDRDTEPIAGSELESMAKSLPVESLPLSSPPSPTLALLTKPPSAATPSTSYTSSPSPTLPPCSSPPPPRALRGPPPICDPDSSVRSAWVDVVHSLAAPNLHSLSSAPSSTRYCMSKNTPLRWSLLSTSPSRLMLLILISIRI